MRIYLKPITNLEPAFIDGERVYIDRGLGAFTQTATNIQNVTNTAASVVSNVPVDPTGYQSTAGKVADVASKAAGIASAAATIAVAANVVPVVGQAVAVVAGVVAGVAFVVGKLFGNSKAKQYAAERGQYEIAIGQIRDENMELDVQITKLQTATNQLKKAIGLEQNSIAGLGLFNSKAKEEEKKLKQAKATFSELQIQQQQKLALIDSLLDQIDRLIQVKDTQKTGIIIAGSIVAIAGLYVLVKKLKK